MVFLCSYEDSHTNKNEPLSKMHYQILRGGHYSIIGTLFPVSDERPQSAPAHTLRFSSFVPLTILSVQLQLN
jgi:hypothetical protein